MYFIHIFHIYVIFAIFVQNFKISFRIDSYSFLADTPLATAAAGYLVWAAHQSVLQAPEDAGAGS